MINLIGLAILGVMIAEWFSPLQNLKNKFKWYEHSLLKHTYCVKCVSFWLGLIITLNLYSAAIISVMAYTISYFLDWLDKKRYN